MKATPARSMSQGCGILELLITNTERATVFQNRATDELLRILRDVAGVAEYLARRSGVEIPVRARRVGVP